MDSFFFFPLGQVCINQVVGWFCRICTMFFRDEQKALSEHCRSEKHYVNFVAYARKKKEHARMRAKQMEKDSDEQSQPAQGGKKRTVSSQDYPP